MKLLFPLRTIFFFISSFICICGAQQFNTNHGLVPFKFEQLPLGSIKASGWLKDQIELSAEGLGGHLFDFYRYVQRSTWLGGDFEYSELHESAPYWFNYIVPMAWVLDDNRLKSQARQFLDYVLEHQAEDGWLGPEKTRETRGVWARSLLLFGLVQYAEADASQTERIVDSIHKFTVLVHSMLKNNFTGLLQGENDNFDPYGFGVSRTHELPISLMWLYETHPRNNSALILETIELMFEGGRKGGRDWTTFFVNGTFPTKGTGTFRPSGFTHGVNLAQGLRYPTVLYRLTNDSNLVHQTHEAINLTLEYQTSLSGTIIGDEHLGGLSPQRGNESELCMAVESMFSYAFLYRFHGSNLFADRAELAAFNALPAAMSPDWWSHQYVTQTNQPWSRNLTANPFFNVVSYSNSFGLEPNFPCCTVNHPQGYPKYVASSFVKYGENGLVHMLLGPSIVETKVKNRPIQVKCRTNYPFSDRLDYEILAAVDFDFYVRIPQWVDETTALSQFAGQKPQSISAENGLYRMSIRKGFHRLSIHLPMTTTIAYRNNTVGVYRGPLLYAADIKYSSSSHRPLNWTDRQPLPTSEVDARSLDWVLEPTSNWRYAIDPTTIKLGRTIPYDTKLPNPLFDRHNFLPSLEVNAYPLNWPETLGTAALPPEEVEVKKSEVTKLKLIPFGAAKLHIAQFPIVK